jgi:hypothetical protein
VTVTGYRAPGSTTLHRPPAYRYVGTQSIATLCSVDTTPQWSTDATGDAFTCTPCNRIHTKHQATLAPWAEGEKRRYTIRRHPGLMYFAPDYGDGNVVTGYTFRLAARPRPSFMTNRDARAPKGCPWRLTTYDTNFTRVPIGTFPTTTEAVDWVLAVEESGRTVELLTRIHDEDWDMNRAPVFLGTPPRNAAPALR